MNKRKPALRIGGGVLNRNTLGSNLDLHSSLSESRTNGNTIVGAQDNIDAEVANFLKEIDEVSVTEPQEEIKNTVPAKFGDWQECIDEKTQHPYYWNTVTDEVTWVLPEEIAKQFAALAEEQNKASNIVTPPANLCEVDTSHAQNESVVAKPKDLDDATQVTNDDLDIDKELERAAQEKDNSGKVDPKVESKIEEHAGDSPRMLKIHQKEPVISSVDNKDSCVECNKLSNEENNLSDSKSETESEVRITEISKTVFGKLKFLGISNAAFTNFHYLLVQIETRIADWKEKALSTSYVMKKLQDADKQLKAYEESATPNGWSCHWDSSAERYFYMNDKTRKMQWEYPETNPSEVTKTGAQGENDADTTDEDDIPAKKSRKEHSDGTSFSPALPSNESMPPLPKVQQEKPPLPPPQPPGEPDDVEGEGDSDNDDDGIMMEISDGEKEDDDAEKSRAVAPSAVMSQQPVLYKGPITSYKVSSPINYQSYGSPSMLPQAIPATKITTGTINEAKTVSTKTKHKKKTKKSSSAVKPSKGMSSLVAQWQKAKDEIEQEDRLLEEEEEEPDREELTQQQIKRWRKEQIASGRASTNANFEPVPNDWRTRLLEKKKRKM